MKKFESEQNALFSVILGHTLNVILGFIPRIHAKQKSNRHPRVCPEDLDSRVKPENDHKQSLIKGLDVVRQYATRLERLKTYIKIHPLFCHPRAWLLARPEDLDSRVKPENNHNNLLPQCAPDATGFLSDVYKRGTRARKFLVDGVQCGRSMIEMLGVLAIIGVLSVGGIQGFSKAMETYQSHKQLEQINSLIYAALELRDGLIQNYKNAPTTQRYDLMPALSALGYLPDMKLVSNHATDKYGNSFNLSFGVDGCRQPDGTVAYTCFSYRMGIYLKTQGTSFSLSSENQCKNLINSLTAFDTENGNIGHLELRNTDTENINGYNVSSIIYGRQNCTNSRQTCFKNMTPIKMTQFCKSCASENLCELYIYFKYQ